MSHIEFASTMNWDGYFAVKGELLANEMFRHCRIRKITFKQAK